MTAMELLESLKSQFTEVATDRADISKKYKMSPMELIQLEKDIKKHYIERLTKPIFEVVSMEDRRLSDKVLVDIIPYHLPTARVFRADNDEYLIIINKRLLGIIYVWTELQVVSIRKLNEDTDRKSFARNFGPIIDCIHNIYSGKTLPVFNFDEIPPQITAVIGLKAMLSEQFIVAHELAHIYLGHLGNLNEIEFNEHIFSPYAFNTSQQNEFDADVQAVKWMMEVLKKQELDEDLLLLCVEVFVLFHLIQCNTCFPTEESTHPSAVSRLINLKDNFSDILNVSNYTIEEMIENCKDIDSFDMR